MVRIGLVLAAAACAAEPPTVDTTHRYRLEELIDLAERAHPQARIAWARLEERAAALGIARSERYPTLALVVLGANEHSISPFPKPLAPDGYTMVDVPMARTNLQVGYALFDFGRRGARIEQARRLWDAEQSLAVRVSQSVAFKTAGAFYTLVTANERLQAAAKILETARTTQSAAEAQLANGRATLPDVLNARAATAQAVYDQAVAEGRERTARVELREAIGVAPSDAIQIDPEVALPEAGVVGAAVEDMVGRTLSHRADLTALRHRIKSTEAELRGLRAELRPTVTTHGDWGGTALWPLSSYGTLGDAHRITWSAGMSLNWTLFDSGRRREQVAAGEARERAERESLREKQDEATREVWNAYLRLQTAARRRDAARTLLEAAETSYSASFEAFQYGVKNLIDVVTAEKQLSEARLATVEARSELLLSAASLEYATGKVR